jgi:hypothetical protein
MVGFDCDENVKVWLNEDIEKNSP